MDTRTTIAAMCLQGILSDNECTFPTKEAAIKCAVEHADVLIAELARTAPPPAVEPLADVKAGDVLIGAGSGRLTLIAVDYPLAVVQYGNPATGKLSEPQPYNLRANPLQCTVASAAILAGLE